MNKELSEKNIESILTQEINRLSGRSYKWVSPGNSGVPDRIVILPDKPVIFVELKTRSGRLTPIQKVQLKRLEDLGQEIYVIQGESGLIEFFRDYLQESDISERLERRFKR